MTCAHREQRVHIISQDRSKQVLTRDVTMNRTNSKKHQQQQQPVPPLTYSIAVDRAFGLMRLCARSFHQNLQQLYITAQWLFGLRPSTDGHASVIIQRQPAATCKKIKVNHRLEFNRNSAGFKLGHHLITKGVIQISVFCMKCLIF